MWVGGCLCSLALQRSDDIVSLKDVNKNVLELINKTLFFQHLFFLCSHEHTRT